MWTRTYGPDETSEMGDTLYEKGSLYENGDERVSITYGVVEDEEADGGFRYYVIEKIESWFATNEENPTITYDYPEIGFHFDEAKARETVDMLAAADESWAMS